MLKYRILQNFIFLQSTRKLFFCDLKTELIPKFPHFKSELSEKLSLLQPNSPENSKVLKIAILGPPNSGKSSLVNMLTKWDTCAVSGKVNTTRSKQTAILTERNIQLCFVDLPGIIGKSNGFKFKLDKSLIRDPHVGIFESDLIICIVDVSHKSSQEELNIELLKALYYFKDKPAILVLNKIDKVSNKMKLFDITRRLTNGIVGGRCCHKDSYANRFKTQIPMFNELLADIKGVKLLNEHLKRKQLKMNDNYNESSIAAVSSEVKIHENVMENYDNYNESSIAAVSSEVEIHENVMENDDNYNESSIAAVSSEVKIHENVIIEIDEYDKVRKEDLCSKEFLNNDQINNMDDENFLDILDESRDKNNNSSFSKDIDSPILDVLKKQLMIHSVTKEEIKTRLAKWREIENYLDDTQKTSWNHFEDVFAVSSIKGTGIDVLRKYLLNRAKPGLWYFHSSMITDQDPRTLIKMSVMAKCLDILDKEIPYKIKIDVQNFEKSETGSVHIHVVIRCKSSRQLMTLLGTGGSNISTIANNSREILEKCFQTDVYLKLTGSRIGIPKEHLKKMRSVTNIKNLFPQSSVQ